MEKKENLLKFFAGLALYMVSAWGLMVLINYLVYKLI
jgi:hypothetical protein